MEEEKSTQEQIIEELREEEKRIKELEERVAKLEQIARLSNQRLVELQRDYELLKERYRRDLEEFRKYGYESLALDILEVLDNFERALETKTEDINALRAGVEMIYRQILAILEKYGIRAMDLDNKEFDPMLAEAVEKELSLDHPPNTVIRTIRKGYYLHDRVLRPGRVVVSYTEEEVT
ncbi:nucleotide exchange factor GrpE [Thermocrinis jamiesonii]|mgnify:CR=1 FL=1|jgi:Molecular chaperone GrpE (heat shock protein)|uniref:nucleotide exchange factor GrpE n=1 Tax=Thermocrinis jamiesonii TaxID=1302351 RepID=UPI000494DC72|nr:nucleotide exchange factor GrpE [Thermocrinis jamiesonii]